MHKCDGCIITCMDWRTNFFPGDLYTQVREMSGHHTFDFISAGGGAKKIVDEQTRQHILSDIELSLRYHGIHTVVLLNHTDCSAYGQYGSLERISSDLQEARRIISVQFPQLDVETYIAHLSQNGKEWIVQCARPWLAV